MSKEKVHRVGIIMNGVTGRMGTNQHLIRSIQAIRDQGGVRISPTETIMPDPLLVGRNEVKIQHLCDITGFANYTLSLEEALSNEGYPVYFDAQTTGRRVEAVRQAIEAGKHIYCEKPVAADAQEAFDLAKLATEKGVKNGVVQDKLWLPGMIKLRRIIESGLLGDILSVRGEFGYWVFEGHSIPAQRPSWNYKVEEGGGIIMDMVSHWHYLITNLFGSIKAISCLGAIHIPERIDEQGNPYKCTAEDAAYATFELDNGVIAHFNSSWTVRVRRDDLLTVQVDGTKGSAVAGLRDCRTQHYSSTPKPVWNPDIPQPINFYDDWAKVPEQEVFDNAFKIQWELFLRHLVLDEPFRYSLEEGAKGVQLAEKGIESWKKRTWINL